MTDDMITPAIALSVRQPWAWAIIHGGKDIENRSWQAVNHGLNRLGRIAVHAAKGMTQREYVDASSFMSSIGVICPPAAELERGGIIGSVEVIGVCTASPSPWFFGPRGLVLRDPEPFGFLEKGPAEAIALQTSMSPNRRLVEGWFRLKAETASTDPTTVQGDE